MARQRKRERGRSKRRSATKVKYAKKLKKPIQENSRSLSTDIPVVGGEDSSQLLEGVINLSDKAIRQLYWLMLDGPQVTQALQHYHQTTGMREKQDSKDRRWGRAELGEILRQEFRRREQEVKEEPIQRS